MTTINEKTLHQIETELGKDGVWVAPAMRNQVSKADEAEIEAAVADATTPTYVTIVDLDYGDPLTNGDASQLANLIRDDTGRPGVYIGVAPQYDDDPYTLEITSFPDDSGLFYAARVAAAEHPDDLTAQTVRTIDLLETGGAEKLYDQLPAEDRYPGSSDDSGIGAGALVGIVIAALAVVSVVVAAVRRRRRRAVPVTGSGSRPAPARPAPQPKAVAPTPTGRSFTLPPAVLSTVRAAEDQRNESRAQADVLALGEAIDVAELDPQRSSLSSWQEALDHYDVARRILDRKHSPADAIGAIVLAGRGRSALTAALAGRDWKPAPSCYFNPLHVGPSAETRWQDGDSAVRVPACRKCAASIRRGNEPDDVLDFVAHGRPAHYFKLDLGAWSSTGYGALDTDVLGRLLESGRRRSKS